MNSYIAFIELVQERKNMENQLWIYFLSFIQIMKPMWTVGYTVSGP